MQPVYARIEIFTRSLVCYVTHIQTEVKAFFRNRLEATCISYCTYKPLRTYIPFIVRFYFCTYRQVCLCIHFFNPIYNTYISAMYIFVGLMSNVQKLWAIFTERRNGIQSAMGIAVFFLSTFFFYFLRILTAKEKVRISVRFGFISTSKRSFKLMRAHAHLFKYIPIYNILSKLFRWKRFLCR